ncbi:MAG: hypothetical protein IJ088_01855 [Clostridia bacterium]|nr:hypothetical protein [Clostridia bacterium]
MYSFDVNRRSRKDRRRTQILIIAVFLLTVLLIGVTYTLLKSRNFEDTTRDVLVSRAISEAGDAQATVYRLTQSSGTSSAALLASVRQHIYCLQCLNTLAGNIYGAETIVVNPDLLSACMTTLDQATVRMQAGNVLTEQFTILRDQINDIAASFNLN